MTFQLPIDCINEIIQHFEQDKTSLGSCLLVNRSWCKVAVRILWRNVWDAKYTSNQKSVPLSILSTLIACLSNESKDLLYENGIYISPPTSKSPLFNYISFIKTLLFTKIDLIVRDALNQHNKYLVLQELFKAFINQISLIKTLDYDMAYPSTIQNIPFVSFS